MLRADLYLKTIKLSKYLNRRECIECGLSSCESCLEAIEEGTVKSVDCLLIKRNEKYALESLNKIKDSWPHVPLLTHPRPSYTGLMEWNNPDEESLLLITGNNEFTEQVLLTVLETTACPFYVIFVDTCGNTIDMSMVYQTFTVEGIRQAICSSGLEKRSAGKEMIIPGLADSLREEIEKLTGWNVRVGPECAAELPLYLSELWIPPGDSR